MKHSFELSEGDLHPVDDREKLLWEQIDLADPPIRQTLKRINRIALSNFPDFRLQTTESCSGHIDTNGHIISDKSPIIFFLVDNEVGRDKAIPTFRSIFQNAVDTTNNIMGSAVIAYGPRVIGYSFTPQGEYLSYADEITSDNGKSIMHSYPTFSCEVHVLRTNDVGEIFKAFWDAVDSEIAKIDGIQISSDRTANSFISA